MSLRRAPKRNLSKGILEMKFMKKSKDKVDKEIEYEESRKLFQNDISKLIKTEGTHYIIEPSMSSIERLLSGRMSFRGMNPEIERLMKQEQQEVSERRKAEDRFLSNQPEITDEEMAKHLAGSIGKRFNSKKANKDTAEQQDGDSGDSSNEETEGTPPKKTKFMKPVD